MALDVPLLRSSFNLVAEAEPRLAMKFYDNLFRAHPEARPLFAHVALEDQAKMLTEALVSVMELLDDGPALTTTLKLLGRRHVSYGVTLEHYDWVGAALLETLGQIAGPAWTPELKAAWAEAYGAITGIMQQGIANAA